MNVHIQIPNLRVAFRQGPTGPMGPASNTQRSRTQAGAGYILQLSDFPVRVRRTHTAAMTLTVPPDATVAFPNSAVILGRNASNYDMTIVAGVGVSIDAADLVIPAHSDFALIKLTDTVNTWDLV